MANMSDDRSQNQPGQGSKGGQQSNQGKTNDANDQKGGTNRNPNQQQDQGKSGQTSHSGSGGSGSGSGSGSNR